VPWGLLHLLANSDLAGSLSSYYAFPYLIASFMPLVGVVLQRRWRGPGEGFSPIRNFIVMTSLSFAALSSQHNPGRIDFPKTFFLAPSATQQAATDRAIRAITAVKPSLGRLLVDNSIAALAPREFARREMVGLGCGGIVQPDDATQPDTMVYFVRGCDAQRFRAASGAVGLDHFYVVRDTSIRIVSNRQLEWAPGLAPLIEPVPAGGDLTEHEARN
jgi:hypothetical protein